MKFSPYLLILIFSLFVLFSCEKDQSVNLNEEVAADAKIGCFPAFTTNPYDSAGLMHNRHLTSIHDIAAPGNHWSVLDVMSISDSVLIAFYGTSISIALLDTMDIYRILESLDQGSMDSTLQTYGLNQASTEHLERVFEIVSEYDGTNSCDLIESIKLEEDNLLGLNSADSVKIALIGSSIARHSLSYWDENDFFNVDGAKLSWRRWFIVACDIAGGITGGIAGSPTIVGGIAGGIAGGVTASAGGAALWDNW